MSIEDVMAQAMRYRQQAQTAQAAGIGMVLLQQHTDSYSQQVTISLPGSIGLMGDIVAVEKQGAQYLVTARYDATAVLGWMDWFIEWLRRGEEQ